MVHRGQKIPFYTLDVCPICMYVCPLCMYVHYVSPLCMYVHYVCTSTMYVHPLCQYIHYVCTSTMYVHYVCTSTMYVHQTYIYKRVILEPFPFEKTSVSFNLPFAVATLQNVSRCCCCCCCCTYTRYQSISFWPNKQSLHFEPQFAHKFG